MECLCNVHVVNSLEHHEVYVGFEKRVKDDGMSLNERRESTLESEMFR